MPELIYINGDITNPIESHCVIAHVVNDIGVMGAGVAKALYTKWPSVKWTYLKWYQTNHIVHPFQLGKVNFVQVDDEKDIVVANMIAQHGIYSSTNQKPIRYDALRKCLFEVYSYCKANKVNLHLPMIGSGLAKGDWNIIEQNLKDGMEVDTYVYQFKN